MSQPLHLLSGGAAQGLVHKAGPLLAQAGAAGIAGAFGAVGAMREKFAAGEPCDLLILTGAMIEALAGAGEVLRETRASLGRVRTGVAVRAGAALPAIADAAGLRRALTAAAEIYFPDPEKATAGIHFQKVLRELGLERELAARLRPFPNGATAMRELAASGDPRALGCTQITEIVVTPGVQLVGPLPKAFELVTEYAVAVTARSGQAAAARHWAELLSGPKLAELRSACGFE